MSMTVPPSTPAAPISGTYQPKGMLIGGRWVGSASGERILGGLRRLRLDSLPR